MANLEDLKKERDELKSKLIGIKHKIEALELEQSLPELQTKYEGKYFKVKNSSGSDNSWWLYTFCRKVINEQEGFCDSFEAVNSYKKRSSFSFQSIRIH